MSSEQERCACRIFALMDKDATGTIDARGASELLTGLGVGEEEVKEALLACAIGMDDRGITMPEFLKLVERADLGGWLPPLSAVVAQLEVEARGKAK
jgi:Ca2+-binding EF-hand superfamily protein